MNAIATLSNWFKNLAPFFQPMRSKGKTNRTLYARFFPCFEHVLLSKLQFVARDSDWLIAQFAPVVIGRSNYLVIGFSTVI